MDSPKENHNEITFVLDGPLDDQMIGNCNDVQQQIEQSAQERIDVSQIVGDGKLDAFDKDVGQIDSSMFLKDDQMIADNS